MTAGSNVMGAGLRRSDHVVRYDLSSSAWLAGGGGGGGGVLVSDSLFSAATNREGCELRFVWLVS